MPEISFTGLDWLFVAAYFAFLMILAFRKGWHDQNEEMFLLSGRRMTLPAFVATLVSTWYGGILGVGEYSSQYGISMILLFGVPFYFFSVIYAFFLADKIRNHLALTIPEAVGSAYGPGAGRLSAIGVFILVSPAPYILMLGLIFQFITGGEGNFLVYAIVVALFSVAYVSFSGFSAVVRTDELQVSLMFGGFLLLIWYAWGISGSPAEVWNSVPETFRDVSGGQTTQYILVWFFIALWTFVDPSFHQRSAAARNGKTARNGILISILFWIAFDFLTLFSGMYGFLILGAMDNPVMVYPYLANEILPVGIKGLFFITLIATIMSTMDSYLFISGQTLGRDLLKGWLPKADPVFLTRLGILIAAVLGILLVIVYPSVIDLWYVIGSVMIPGLLIPVLGVYLPVFRVRRLSAVLILTVASGISLAWLVAGTWHGDADVTFLGVEPFYPGLFVSFLIFVIDRASGRRVRN
ncbi:MAG: sodium:solute symporter family protein [Cyclonatronaceae bacterium]